MDLDRLDHLARSLASAGSRRRLLGLLAATPVAGGLLSLLTPEETDAKDRRRRRKQRHNSRKDPGNRKKKGCKPKSKATVCGGQCGPVTNRQTCGKTIDCGSCACTPPCAACQTCDGSSQTCVDLCRTDETCCEATCVDVETDAANCGACGNVCPDGQSCQDGACGFVCGSDFCPAASEICVDDVCQTCDVCTTCNQTTVQGAIDAAALVDTIAICAGTYTRQGIERVAAISDKNLTLIGAGTGAGGTILDGDDVSTPFAVVSVQRSETELRNLVVTGSTEESGLLSIFPASLTLTGVLVTGNTNLGGGGGIFNNDRVVLNTGTVITGNSAIEGGGIANNAANSLLTLNPGSRVIDNEATNGPSGISNRGTVVALPGSEVENCVDVAGGQGCPA